MILIALTSKQEKFCQCVASGKSYKEAYLIAYDTKGKDSTVLAESAKLALREDIQERIKALLKPIEQAAQVQGFNAREEQIKFIKSRIEHCTKKEDEASLIRWNDQLNKIYSLYGKEEEKENNDNNLTNIDTSILNKIAKIG